MKVYEGGDKYVVEIPRWLREKQPCYIGDSGDEFYKELIQWIDTLERDGLEFLCIDYFGLCWFRKRNET